MKRVALALFLAAANGWGQCVMCYRTAEAQNAARSHILNMGIVLLGAPPFVILAGFIALAFRRSQAYGEADFPGGETLSGAPDENPLPISAR
jgi:hypothetical protein